jgi:hypothetical protein
VVWRAVLVVPSHEPPRASLVSECLGLLVGDAPAVRAPRGVAPRGAQRGRSWGGLVAAAIPPAACRCGAAGPGATAGAPGDTAALDATAMGLPAAAPAREALCASHGADAMIAEMGVDQLWRAMAGARLGSERVRV